jgi:4-aminobutyrate aminotransferase-like enzyme
MASDISGLLARRERLLGPNVATFYDDPLHIVRGQGVWLWDADGRKYLDCYNNVPHVGHCHPRVVEAICKQAATLNTHTRYVHELVLDYIEQLTATMHAGLTCGVMTCTGSEANDLALRMARSVTGRTGIIATDHTYHGNSMVVSQLSKTSKPAGPAFENVRFVTAPGQEMASHAFAQDVARKIDELNEAGHGFSALLLCPFFANEGFPDQAEDWLRPAAEVVRKAEGLLIADEIQPGFGRIGSHMWGYERAGIVPDIVTLGKSMANGHPVGAAITSSELMKAFRTETKYFNTFGGNPVSCAAALATLQVMQDEDLMLNANHVGAYAKSALGKLGEKHATISGARGRGLFFGAEIVEARERGKPSASLARRLVNALRVEGVLINVTGRYSNILKVRPPMPFSRDNADQLLQTLEHALNSIAAQA